MSDSDSITPKAFNAPTYTQIPNEWFDEIMPQITSLAEERVTLVIMRKTFGWHKEEDMLSLSQLERLTGLTRRSVAEGVKLALERGFIGRRKEGQTYFYGLRVTHEDSSYCAPTSVESIPVTSVESIPTKERVKESKEPSTNVDGKVLSTAKQMKGWDNAPTGVKQAYLVAWLHERVDERGLPVPSPAYKERLSGELRNALNEGRGHVLLFEALFHITNRWEHTKLSLWQALNDIDARKRRQQMKVVDTPSEWKEPEPFYDEQGQAWIDTPRGKRRFVNADR